MTAPTREELLASLKTLKRENTSLRKALREVEQRTAVGPPSHPGRKTPGSTWYDLLVRVNAYARAALKSAGSR